MVVVQQRFGLRAFRYSLERRLERDGLLKKLLVERADGIGERGLDVACQLRRGGVLGNDRVAQRRFVFRRGVQDAVLDHVNERCRLDADDLAVFLNVYLVAGEDLLAGVHALTGEHFDVFRQNVGGQRLGGVAQVGKAALLSLLDPGLLIAVAVEDDAAVGTEGVADELVQRRGEIPGVLELFIEIIQLVGHDRVEDRDRPCDGLRGAGHTELELVAREGERRGAVAVGGVLRDGRQHVNADAQRLVLGGGVVVLGNDGVDDALKLRAEEDGDDGRRSLLRAQTVVIACKGNRAAQQLLIFVHALDEGGEHQQEERVLAGGLAGGEEVLARVGRERPVDVLARAVHAG